MMERHPWKYTVAGTTFTIQFGEPSIYGKKEPRIAQWKGITPHADYQETILLNTKDWMFSKDNRGNKWWKHLCTDEAWCFMDGYNARNIPEKCSCGAEFPGQLQMLRTLMEWGKE